MAHIAKALHLEVPIIDVSRAFPTSPILDTRLKDLVGGCGDEVLYVDNMYFSGLYFNHLSINNKTTDLKQGMVKTFSCSPSFARMYAASVFGTSNRMCGS